MKAATTLLTVALSPLWAQPAKKAPLTAEDIIERSIAATGGRATIEAVTSRVAKAEVEILPAHAHFVIEYYAKAPAKRLIVTKMEGFGEVRQGCDGSSAWTEDPGRGVRELAGAEKQEALRECVFHAETKWRELYTEVKLAGKEKVGEREAYKVIMRPASGQPVIRFVDAENFLLLRQVSTRDSPQGVVTVRADMSDYREVDGIKIPFQTRQTMPGLEMHISMLAVENNVPIDDARFAKPAAK